MKKLSKETLIVCGQESVHTNSLDLVPPINTFASPYLQDPIALGAGMVMHSATKYIGGYGNIIGGVVVGTREHMNRIREKYTNHFGPG